MPMYNTHALMNQYKCHILPLLESITPAVYHASTTTLAPLQGIQDSFLKAMAMTDNVAFTVHALAPLQVRRDIAMLGFLFKCCHRQVGESAHSIFKPALTGYDCPRRRPQHSKPLFEYCDGRHLEVLQNSLFGLIRVFNTLPDDLIQLQDVHAFQSALTGAERRALEQGHQRWMYMYSSRVIHR